MERVVGTTRTYDWGCARTIPELLGRPPDGVPWAEYWLGAHPQAAARLPDGTPLDTAVGADPGWAGGAWPHLFKLLAANKPLSIQVHPNSEQARLGWQSQGGAQGAFTDAHPKPEMLVALTPTQALAGWAPDEQAAQVAVLCGLLGRVEHGTDPVGPLAARTATVLLADRLAAAQAHRRLDTAVGRGRLAPGLRHLALVRAHHPRDHGLVLAALLARHDLEPGAGLFVPETTVHAYLGGAGVEVMSPSDNVLRAGLTRKAVDAAAVLRIADLTGRCAPSRIEPAPIDANARHVRWSPPGVPWQLTRYVVEGHADVAAGASMLWCERGALDVQDSAGHVALRGGEAAAARADATDRRALGHGTLWQLTSDGGVAAR